MRLLSLLVFCHVLLWTTLASGDPCRHIEYAELQDIPTEDLVRIYCEFGKTGDVARQEYYLYEKAASLMGDPRSSERAADRAERNWRTCTAVQGAIITTLKKRGVAAPPPCKGPSTNK